MNTANRHEQIWESLQNDPEFRKQFIDEHINVGIAFQIRSLRERQKLTQTKLAKLLGNKNIQPMISEWENPNYGKYTLNTLKDLAKVFDVGLLVRFVSFNTLVDWTVDLTKDIVAPASFSEEQPHAAACAQAMQPFEAASTLKEIQIDANVVIHWRNLPELTPNPQSAIDPVRSQSTSLFIKSREPMKEREVVPVA